MFGQIILAIFPQALSRQYPPLRLSHMQGHLDALLRQAKENGVRHEDFLLSLTEIKLQMRAENRLRRMIRDHLHPLL